MGYITAFILGSWLGVGIMCLMRVAKLADEEMEDDSHELEI